MRKILFTALCFGLLLVSCSGNKKIVSSDEITSEVTSDTLKIANEALEYEIIIIEPGFNQWLNTVARPEGFYSQSFMENRNRLYVIEWNSRVMQAQRFDSNLYEMQIDYRSTVDYGYDVNYKLYNYFLYFQDKYKQRLSNISRI